MFERRTLSEEVASLKQAFDRTNWKAMTTLGFDNSKGTTLYDYQVEFCYLMDSIERDSTFIARKQIPKVRLLIDELRDEISAKERGESSD